MDRWQFSVRDLLIATTIVSICLAVGVHFAGFGFVLLAIGAMQAAMLLAGDWLMRPQNRRALAFGSGLLMMLISTILSQQALPSHSDVARWALEVCLAVGCVVAYLVAAIRWRQLTQRSGAK